MKTFNTGLLRYWLLGGLMLCLSTTALAQKKSGIGTISEIWHTEEYLYLNDDDDLEFGFNINEVKVTLQDIPVRLSFLQHGLIIRYETDTDGYTLLNITVLGPKNRLEEYFNQ